MAEIYRAKTFGAAGFEKELVIKRILPQFTVDEEFVRMFIDEARLAAKLQHANIVQIYDFDCAQLDDGDSYYLAMELVDGKDLRHLLKEGVRRKLPLSIPQCLHIAVETLKGLHYAHSKADGGQPLNIVHRDVSPHNVLISYSGDVKISDFGIAKAAARASVTTNGMVKGKLAYMSPEQVTGQSLDRRSDIFSMGIVLYETLTQSRLFVGENETQTVERVRDARVPPPRSRNPNIPPDVEAAVLRMLAHKPDARFQTAAEAARALSTTSAYSANEDIGLGEYVAQLFPPVVRAAEAAPPVSPSRPTVLLPGAGGPSAGPGAGPAGSAAEPQRATAATAARPTPAAPRPAPATQRVAPATPLAAPPAASESPTEPGDDAGAPLLAQKTVILDSSLTSPPPAAVAEPSRAKRTLLGSGSAPAKPQPAAAPAGSAAPAAPAKPAVAEPVLPTATPTGVTATPIPPPEQPQAELPPLTEQRTVILDGGLAGVSKPAAPAQAVSPAEGRAAAPAVPPQGELPPLTEQKTVIFDGGGAPSPAARPQAAPAAPPGGLPPLTEQKTVIFDGGATPPGAAQSAGLPPLAEQRTVIFSDPSSPGAPQAPTAPRGSVWDSPAGMAASGRGAPGGGAPRTMALDVPQSLGPPGQPPQPGQAAPMTGARSLPPLASPKGGRRWMRWVLGMGLMLGTALLTLVVSAYALPAERFRPKEPPPPVVTTARLEVSSHPSGASITIDGKPWPEKTPTRIKGEVGQTVHIECRLDGQIGKADITFTPDPPPLEIPLTPDPKAQKLRPAPTPSEVEAPPPSSSKRPSSRPSRRSSGHR